MMVSQWQKSWAFELIFCWKVQSSCEWLAIASLIPRDHPAFSNFSTLDFLFAHGESLWMRLGNSYMLWFYYSNEIIFQPSNLPNYNIQDTVSYRCATCIYCNVWRTLLNVGELCLADEIPSLQFMNVPNFGCPIIWKGGKDSAILEHSDSGKKEIRKWVMTIESK